MENIKIYHNGKDIIIKSVEDLPLLPDKSIKVLFNNQSYVATLYAYVMSRTDNYLQEKEYSTQTRVKYFNACVKNLDSLLEYEKEYLNDNSTAFVIKSEKFPKDLEKIYKESIITTCNFFRGVVSTTPYLDKNLFPKEAIKKMRHNYGNMIAILLNSVEK